MSTGRRYSSHVAEYAAYVAASAHRPAGAESVVFKACASCARVEDACACDRREIKVYGAPPRHVYWTQRPVPVGVRPADAAVWRHLAGECTDACRHCKARAARLAAGVTDTPED